MFLLCPLHWLTLDKIILVRFIPSLCEILLQMSARWVEGNLDCFILQDSIVLNIVKNLLKKIISRQILKIYQGWWESREKNVRRPGLHVAQHHCGFFFLSLFFLLSLLFELKGKLHPHRPPKKERRQGVSRNCVLKSSLLRTVMIFAIYNSGSLLFCFHGPIMPMFLSVTLAIFPFVDILAQKAKQISGFKGKEIHY